MLLIKKFANAYPTNCMITKLTRERAANPALRELLEGAENDPPTKERMDRAKALQEASDNL